MHPFKSFDKKIGPSSGALRKVVSLSIISSVSKQQMYARAKKSLYEEGRGVDAVGRSYHFSHDIFMHEGEQQYAITKRAYLVEVVMSESRIFRFPFFLIQEVLLSNWLLKT